MRGLYKIGAACLVAVFAVAIMSGVAEASKADAQNEYNEKPWQLQDRWGLTFAGADVNEAETNDTPGTANPYTMGDTFHGEIKAADVDYVSFPCSAGDRVEIGTDADLLAGPTVDTKITLYDTDGTTQLAFNDDGGPGLYSLITYDITANGTYYLKIEGFSGTSAGFYILQGAQTDPPEPPANDDCAGGIAVPCGVNQYSGSTELAVNDYTPSDSLSGDGCTGYYAQGGDVVYVLNLTGTETVDISYANAADASLYIVTDCNDPQGTCVAGADNTFTGQAEVINGFSGTGTFYIILDTFSGFTPGGAYTADITVNCPTATEDASWSEFKDLFR